MLNLQDWLDEHEAPQTMGGSIMYVRSEDVRELVDQIRRELSEPVASSDVETWIAAKKYYTTIANPEAFDGTESVSVAELREFLGAWMAGHARVPEEADPLPDTYSSWDVGYNAGWNDCRNAMLTASKEPT